MDRSTGSQTSPTLLGRLGGDPHDQAAWAEFVRRYGPRILGWCRRWHLQDADAEDVTQGVLLRLAEKLPTFRYDPGRSFRAWLRTLTHHALSDFLEGCRRRAGGRAEVAGRIDSVPARDDLAARLEEEFDRELADEAMARVRRRVDPVKWEVFRLTAVEGLPGAEVARRVGMKVAVVFTVRSKVQQMVRDELRRLGAEDLGPPEAPP